MPVRSAHSLAAQLGLKTCTLSEKCVKYEWVRRAAAWDAEVDRRQLEAQVSELEKMRKQQIQIGAALEMVGAVEVQALQQKQKRADEMAKQAGFVREPILSVRDTVRVIVAGSNLRRINMNQPTSVEEHQVNVNSSGIGAASMGELVSKVQEALKLFEAEKEGG